MNPVAMVFFSRDRFLYELKNDKAARDALLEDNRKYDAEIRKLEKELQRIQKEDPTREKIDSNTSLTRSVLAPMLLSSQMIPSQLGKHDKVPHLDCEKYRKYLEQVKIKESLKRQLAVDRERLRIMIEARTDITEMNVDNLSQAELIRIVKQLERRKVDAASKLQQAENSLDTTAREVAKLRDALKMYQTEIDLRDRKRGATRLSQVHKF